MTHALIFNLPFHLCLSIQLSLTVYFYFHFYMLNPPFAMLKNNNISRNRRQKMKNKIHIRYLDSWLYRKSKKKCAFAQQTRPNNSQTKYKNYLSNLFFLTLLCRIMYILFCTCLDAFLFAIEYFVLLILLLVLCVTW